MGLVLAQAGLLTFAHGRLSDREYIDFSSRTLKIAPVSNVLYHSARDRGLLSPDPLPVSTPRRDTDHLPVLHTPKARYKIIK